MHKAYRSTMSYPEAFNRMRSLNRILSVHRILEPFQVSCPPYPILKTVSYPVLSIVTRCATCSYASLRTKSLKKHGHFQDVENPPEPPSLVVAFLVKSHDWAVTFNDLHGHHGHPTSNPAIWLWSPTFLKVDQSFYIILSILICRILGEAYGSW